MAEVAAIGWPHDLLTLDEWETLDIGEDHYVEGVEGVLIAAPRSHFRHHTACSTPIRLDLDALNRR